MRKSYIVNVSRVETSLDFHELFGTTLTHQWAECVHKDQCLLTANSRTVTPHAAPCTYPFSAIHLRAKQSRNSLDHVFVGHFNLDGGIALSASRLHEEASFPFKKSRKPDQIFFVNLTKRFIPEAECVGGTRYRAKGKVREIHGLNSMSLILAHGSTFAVQTETVNLSI